MIACAFKGAIQAINVSLIVSGFLLLIENALAAHPTRDAALNPDIISQLRQADGVFHESVGATTKKFCAKATSFRAGKAIAHGG